ncbi:PLP-dependent aminotransferase family protein [Senegalimassilia anaerobia]|uniref:MocR-like pyridoxine biosynthesis transcription factor PdxR n=1 Tax=Senegalimassilia anaerobia TaxID=1473216 RepID=UPI0025F9F7CF|nr:PLP-dependent aminotransferase family protein [Senegalimassilia anaerobia]
MSASQQAGMLTYDLRSRGTSSLYEFLYQSIREDIARGRIPCGTKLPSKRNLAQHLDIGVATVTAAYDQLITEGFVRTEQRRGYFVEDVSEFRCKPVTPQVKDSSSEDGTSVGAECGAQDAAAGVFAAHGAQDARFDDASAGRNSRHRGTARSSADTASDAPAAETPHAIERARDPEYFVDLKANRTSVSLFPATVWGRYMREALSLPSDNLLRSIPFNGLPELRRAIASYLRRTRGMDVSPDCIIIGAGSEYLYGRLLQMLGPTTTFAMENPGYRKFAAISKAFGNPWRPVPIDESGLLVDELEESGADVVHVSPANHFPTGIVMPIKRRLELFEWANRARKRYIIEDDYDSEFRYSGRLIMPLFADDASDKVIYLNAFSKTMVPSLRISYMVLPPKLLARYVDTMSFYSCTVSSFEQYALARFIDEGHLERHINRTRNFYRRQREAVLREIAQSPLAKISHVEERNAGTHFLLYVRTSLTHDQVRQRGAEQGLNISLFNDYLLRDSDGLSERTTKRFEQYSNGETALVLNYAGIEPERLSETVRRLACVFPE